MAGILAQILGETTAEQKARVEEATKNANDLSSLVKKKKSKAAPAKVAPASAAADTTATNGKRKLEEPVADSNIKRAKTEELADAS
jgi:HAT1-interacting factor 1